MENIDEESPMELAICLSVNWLLLWLRFAKQAKLFLEWCVCVGGRWLSRLEEAFDFCSSLLPLPSTITSLTPFWTWVKVEVIKLSPPPHNTHRLKKAENPGEKERRPTHKSHNAYNMWWNFVCNTARVEWEGGHCPLQSCTMQNIPHYHPRIKFEPPLIWQYGTGNLPGHQMQKFAQHKLCFVKMFTLFFVVCRVVALLLLWLLHPHPGYRSLTPVETFCSSVFLHRKEIL